MMVLVIRSCGRAGDAGDYELWALGPGNTSSKILAWLGLALALRAPERAGPQLQEVEILKERGHGNATTRERRRRCRWAASESDHLFHSRPPHTWTGAAKGPLLP